MNPLKLFLAVLVFAFIHSSTFAQQNEGATIGGYGELHYNDVTYNANGENTPGELDFHRFILFVGYNFNDWISFRSELELEHTFIEPGEGGEVALEQAYVDLRFQRELGLRAGIMLVPVGIVNPIHEPPTFHGVERPNVERYIIPSTWRESGIGIYGNTESGLSYELYAMAGLNPEGITGSGGIRSGRQKAFESTTGNFALTGRLDYRVNLNLEVGASYFFSTLDHLKNDATGNWEKIGTLEGSNINLAELHLQYQTTRFQARALGVYSILSDSEDLNALTGNAAGESQVGAYGELAYDILPFFDTASEQQLFVFGRYETYDTQFTTAGVQDQPFNHRDDYTFGLTWKPAPRVAFKGDYQILNRADQEDIHQLNFGVGYNF